MNWRVNADLALDHWEPGQPEARVDEVHGWLLDLAEHGPPVDSVSAPWDEDLLVAIIPTARIVATFLAIAHDRLIIVRRFEDL